VNRGKTQVKRGGKESARSEISETMREIARVDMRIKRLRVSRRKGRN
jgi:hypothetical protein